MRILLVYPLEGTPYSEDTSFRNSALKAAEVFQDGEFTTIPALIKMADLKKYHGSASTEGENMAEIVKYIIDSADVVFFCKGWPFTDTHILTIVKNTANVYNKRIIYE